MEKSKHFLWIDLLKIVSIYAVILIHSAAPLLVQYDTIGGSMWWIGNLYNSIARWCIPVFIMISGSLLIGEIRTKSLVYFFKHRFQRVFIPLLFWSFVYFLWNIGINGEQYSIAYFPLLFFTEPIYYHLWFLYILLQLYLLVPIFGSYVKGSNTRISIYLVIIWLIFGSIVPMAEHYFGIDTYFSIGTLNSVFNYAGYFIAGYLLGYIQLRPALHMLCISIFVMSALVTAYGTYYVTVIQNRGIFDGLFYEYVSVNVIGMSLSVYAMVKSIRLADSYITFERRFGVTRFIAGCVPGIYLVHAMIIAVLKRGMLGITMSETTFHPGIGIPLFAFVVFVGSLLPVVVIKCIPGVKYVVP